MTEGSLGSPKVTVRSLNDLAGITSAAIAIPAPVTVATPVTSAPVKAAIVIGTVVLAWPASNPDLPGVKPVIKGGSNIAPAVPHGSTNGGVKVIERIAEALDVNPLVFFVDTKKPSKEQETEIQEKKKKILALIDKELDSILHI